MAILDAALARQVVRAMAAAVADNRARLSALDAALGDGDHGHNLAAALATAVAGMNDGAAEPGEVLGQLGRSMINEMGGAAGVIFGSFFSAGGRRVRGKTALAPADVLAFFDAGIAKVGQRGKAGAGDKTLLDALLPARVALETAVAEGMSLDEALGRAAEAADRGAAATAGMVARHGRARFLGERSVGHPDPGATSMALLLNAWAGVVAGVQVKGEKGNA